MRRLGLLVLAALTAGLFVSGTTASAATGPSVTWLAPNVSTVSGTPTIKVAADPSATLVIFNDGFEWAMSKQPDGTYTYPWDTTNLTDGTYDVQVYAEANGVQGAHVTKRIAVDNCTATATIGAPSAGATLTGVTTITGTVAPDPSPLCTGGIQGVDVFVDGARVGGGTLSPDGTTYSYSWDTNLVANGPHQVQVAANDGQSDAPSPAVSVSTDNTNPTPAPVAPTIAVSNPGLAGQTVTISGQAAPGATVTLNTSDAKNGDLNPAATTTADASGAYSFARALAYNTTLHTESSGLSSAVQTVLLKVKVTINSVAFQYKDSRGKCVVKFTGGTYPYIPGALTYIRTTAGTPVGGTKVVQYGASGRYTALFGLTCGQSYTLFPLIAGKTSTGAQYTQNGTGSPWKIATPR